MLNAYVMRGLRAAVRQELSGVLQYGVVDKSFVLHNCVVNTTVIGCEKRVYVGLCTTRVSLHPYILFNTLTNYYIVPIGAKMVHAKNHHNVYQDPTVLP